VHLTADFPNFSRWSLDQAKYTDEGWWAGAAVSHHLLGHWYMPGDYNPAVAVPVWPVSLGLLFHFTGVSLVAARAFSVVTSLATLALVFLLVQRYSGKTKADPYGMTNKSFGLSSRRDLLLFFSPATIAILLLASSPFAFVFSRLAILDSFVIFQFCLLLLVASYSSQKPRTALAVLSVLVPAILLTKTTALVLLPAVAWLTWPAMKPRLTTRHRIVALVVVGMASTVLVRGYVALVFRSGFGADYKYFFDINQVEEIDWKQTIPIVLDLLKQCLWVDRIAYPLAILAVLAACFWLRRLWRNPLFTASCLAFAGQATYIFIRQGNYAPRYFLPMLVPVVILVALSVDELQNYGDSRSARMTVRSDSLRSYSPERKADPYGMTNQKANCLSSRRDLLSLTVHGQGICSSVMAAAAVAFAINLGTILSLLHHPTFQFYDAGKSIERITRQDPGPNHLILGVSGSEISLMTGLPSINDVYGTDTLDRKIARYRPGWYLAWTGIGPDELQALAGYRIEQVATWAAFDDDERNRLILYRLTPK
jgi:hypothetical protein